MPISDVASLVGGAALGAPVSEIFKLLIEEAKKVKDFKPISVDLSSTMERLVPIVNMIDSMQVQLGSTTGTGELKFLLKTMERAEEMVSKCSRVQWYSIAEKAWYTRKIKGINQDFLRFCQLDLQLILHRNQLHSMHSMSSLSTKIDILSDTVKGSAELFAAPQPETVTMFWLLRPLRELKKMLLEDQVVTVVVSAPSACGKTMLVTKLCHDADIKGKFKQIFFITASKAPNVSLIVQRFLQYTGREAKEFADNSDAKLCIQQLLKQLGESGPILLVLDDVWPDAESLLDTFLIQLPDYKILVTSRFEFLRFGPTYSLETLIDEDVKNLFMDCTPQPDCLTCAKRNDLLLKIGNPPCNLLLPAANPPCSIRGGCNSEIEHERPVNVSVGVLGHRECFCCDACHKPIAINEVQNHVSNSRGKFHKSCYYRYCYVCKERVKMKKFHQHPFWKERYCPAHETDGTPKCFSCARLEPRGSNHVKLDDRRWLCLECMESAVMDTYEVQPLHFEIREFFEGLNMKIEKEFPLLLVEKQALDRAKEEEKIDFLSELVARGICPSEAQTIISDYQNGEEVIGGICLSGNQIVTSVSKGPRVGQNKQLIGLGTESQMVESDFEVTAILVLYGLPRLMTGYIVVREMMHAYLRLNEYRNLNKVLEEGICQVLAHMWLESQTYATTCGWSLGRNLVEFWMNNIETDESPVYGDGFRKVNRMVSNSSLPETLREIRRWGGTRS